MRRHRLAITVVASLTLISWGVMKSSRAEEAWHFIFPEQRRMEIRDPVRMPRAPLPDVPVPDTVAHPAAEIPPWNLSLDESIRIALANSDVVRVLAGFSAVASGSTIYDPAITNTTIDQARGRFDPTLQIQNNWNRAETPQGIFSPTPPGAVIGGNRVDAYDMRLGLSKPTVTGGSLNMGVNADTARANTPGLPLNPQTASSFDLGFTQPLLQGAGVRANMAPIEIARLDTERSFFQLKDSVQSMVRGVIEGYWALVFSRTDLWARRQQVEQGAWALQFAEAKLKVGLGNASEVAQARSALATFRANLVTSEASVLQREAALRNIMKLPPVDNARIVPITPPPVDRHQVDWSDVLRTAETYRPDLIELKLILEADQQQLIIARNDALPRLDANALYRWNGLEGRTPDRTLISSEPGQFTGWQFGVNFSVPLGLRTARAGMRRQELLLTRDRANLDQALHSVSHSLASTYRNLAQYYEQYLAFQEAREAARLSLERQLADYRAGRRTLYLNVLQAITDWGNSVSAEAQTLAQYNTELAVLQQQMGQILESHGIRFTEERYGSIGPLGRLCEDRCYPLDRRPCPNEDRYRNSDQPAENAFNLNTPVNLDRGAPKTSPEAAPPEDGNPLRPDVPGPRPEQVPPPEPGPERPQAPSADGQRQY